MQPAVYILANERNGTIYIGVTSNLIARVYNHKNPSKDCFTKKYNCNKLVYYEIHSVMDSAISREKKLKRQTRKQKIELIESMNKNWIDLYYGII